MICPFCSSGTKIYNSRQTDSGLVTWRRHRCKQCQAKFTSRERIDWGSLVKVRNSKGEIEPYQHAKLYGSIFTAFYHKKPSGDTLSSLCDNIEAQCNSQKLFQQAFVTTESLIRASYQVLARFDRAAALAYLMECHQGEPPQELIELARNQ